MMEQKESEDAWYSELLTTTPVDMPVKSEDDATDQRTRASPEIEGLSMAVSPGLHWREAYCLLMQVTRNVDSVSMLDAKVPNYVWTEVIARDICTYRVGAPANTFTIELLSDTKFLLFEGPQSGPGINWENAIAYIRILHDIRDWGGMEVTMVAGQHTMKQSWIDLANMREYHWARILGRLATVEGKAWSLAIENAKTPTPQGRGWGYTRRADHYLAQRVARGLALEPTLHVLRPATRRITTLHESLLSSSMGVRDWKVQVPTPQDTLLLLWQHLIMTPTIPNAVIPRIETINARNRSIVTGGKVIKLILGSCKTREMVG